MDQYSEIIQKLDDELSKFDVLNEFEKKTRIPKTAAVLSISFVALVFSFLNYAGSFIANFVGFLYPSYASFRAIESPEPNDDTQWLTYWVVFAFLSMIEFWSDRLLSWFPFYYFVKIAVLLWLYMPATRGATLLYGSVVRPTFLKIESHLEQHSDIRDKIASGASKIKEAATSRSVNKVISETKSQLDEAKSALD